MSSNGKPKTLRDYVAARAVQSLVNYWHDMGGRESDWPQVTLFAYREFRNASPETVEALVRMAKAAHLAAVQQSALPPGQCLTPDCIPGQE